MRQPADPSTTLYLAQLQRNCSHRLLTGVRTQWHCAQVQTKVMNNYMGIGVDAKVSLEFDRLRTSSHSGSSPRWVRASQLLSTQDSAVPALTHDVRQSKVFCDIPPAVHGWIILQSACLS